MWCYSSNTISAAVTSKNLFQQVLISSQKKSLWLEQSLLLGEKRAMAGNNEGKISFSSRTKAWCGGGGVGRRQRGSMSGEKEASATALIFPSRC